MTITLNDKLGSRSLKHLNLFVALAGSEQVIAKFEGGTLPGLFQVIRADFTKNGKWSHNTWTVEPADGVSLFTIAQDWETGKWLNSQTWGAAMAEFIQKAKRAEVLQEPLPKIEDASRVSLPVEELEAMKRSMQRAYADNVQRVQAENFSRLYDVAKALRDSLDKFSRGEQKTVHATMLETIEKACSYCNEFNLSGDAHLSALVEDMRNSLTQYTMEEVRTDPVKRAEVSVAATTAMTKAAARKAALANMSGYMN